MKVAPGDYVRTHELAVEGSVDVARRDAVREPGLEGSDTGRFPSADQQIGRAVDTGSKLLSAAKRQIVDVGCDKPLVDVEVGQAIVQLGTVIVHESLIAGARCADTGGRGLVVLALRPG